jgi:ligand-binding sensor domain-containing protein/signal transduction histidine kinase
MRRLFLFLLSFLLPLAAFARVSMADGGTSLPDKFITAICRDTHGLMWIGTKQGVCNYDGTRFEPLEGDLKSDASVARLIYVEKGDFIWAATSKGLYQIQCGSHKTKLISNKNEWSHSAVTALYLLSGGDVYAGYVGGEIAEAFVGGKLVLTTKIKSEGSRQPFTEHIEFELPGFLNYQLASRPEWYAFNLKNGRSKKIISAERSFAFKKSFGDTLVREIGAEGGLQIIKGNSSLFPKSENLFKNIYNVVDVLFTDPGSCYIICKQARLYHFDLVNGKADTVSSDLFKEKLSTCLFLDDDKILWVGTNKGLLKVTPDKQMFTSMLMQTPPLSVRSMIEDDKGNIYAGTYSGLYRYSTVEKNWKKINTEIFYAMLNIPGRYIYLITEQLRLFRMDKQSMSIETNFYQNNLPLDARKPFSTALVSTGDGTIWIGTSEGMMTYHIPTSTLSESEIKGLPDHARIVNITHARNGHLWLSTRNGIFEFNPQKGIVGLFNAHTNPALSVSSVNYTYEDEKGRLWICTQGGGLNMIDATRKKISVLKTEAGLSDNETYQLIWQGDQRIWISTFNGLSSYSPQTGTFSNYYVEDGLPSNEFNHNAFLKARDGSMYFGGINGIAVFNPQSIPELGASNRLIVSSISKWDNKRQSLVHLSPMDTASDIILNPLDHSLAFDLALDDYENTEAQIFQYRIKGLFDEWVTLNSQHTLRLDGLAPGHYELEIKAIDRRGAPSLNTLHYNIQVGQFFYRTAWFYLLLFVVASGLLWAFFYLRLQHVKRVQKIRERLASDLHDEVGSLLTRITMTSDNLQYGRNSETERSSKLQKIASLSRNAASSMSDILWAIDARNDYTGNLADRMREHAEEMLATVDVQPEFEFSVNQRMSIRSELRQQLYLLYKEAINNIVKHSKPTEVRIKYHHNENGFGLSIFNNGLFEKERPSNGQGLKNIRMRAERVGARAEIDSDGDTFLVKLTG